MKYQKGDLIRFTRECRSFFDLPKTGIVTANQRGFNVPVRAVGRATTYYYHPDFVRRIRQPEEPSRG